ncbi:MAG: hypothetical protein KIT83_03320 [Bryobacterales bacterium]|nr:hypothetical protein [Bryobacterales bacterium]
MPHSKAGPLAYDGSMSFVASRYHPEVASVLALDGEGNRPLPLLAKGCVSTEVRSRMQGANASEWFRDAGEPEAALAGLWLYFSCFAESHAISQEIHTPEGSYWHGILHRQEPDNWNAKYWLRRAGRHAVHPALHDAATEIVAKAGNRLELPATWDALWFADLCDAAAHDARHPHMRETLAIQLAEWQLLFDYCASPRDAVLSRT